MQLRHVPCNVNAATALALAVALTTPSFSNRAFLKPDRCSSMQEVMDHFVSAIGGRDAIFKHRSMTVHGKFLLSGKGPTADRSVYYKDGKRPQPHRKLTEDSTHPAPASGHQA